MSNATRPRRGRHRRIHRRGPTGRGPRSDVAAPRGRSCARVDLRHGVYGPGLPAAVAGRVARAGRRGWPGPANAHPSLVVSVARLPGHRHGRACTPAIDTAGLVILAIPGADGVGPGVRRGRLA